MRRIVFIVFGIIASVSIGAQNYINQHTKDLSLFSSFKSFNQQIIEQVVNSGVFIIKQSYELADSVDNRYGLNGNKAFDTDYTLAIKIKNGYLTTDRTIHPWDYNLIYDQYRGKYIPKLFSSFYSEISANARYDSIRIVENSADILFSGLLYAQKSDLFFGDGFSGGGNIGDNDGWMVWFTKKNRMDLSKTTELSTSIIKKKLVIAPKKENEPYFYQVDSLATNDEVLGGIFVIPEVVSVGHLELRLCGVVCRIENGWILCCPFIHTKNILSSLDLEETTNNVSTLLSNHQFNHDI